MTVFRKTILGKILGGVAKAATFVAPVVLPLVGAGAVAGIVAAKPGGLFSKIGGLFKKKASGAGTVLGNFVSDTTAKIGASAKAILAEEVGSTAHAIVDNVVSSGGGSPSDPILAAAVKGAKSGAVSGWLKQHVGILIVGAIGLVFIFSLIFHKRR